MDPNYITQAIEAETTVEARVKVLLGGLTPQIAAAAGDPIAVQTLAEEITANTEAWAQAVASDINIAAVQE